MLQPTIGTVIFGRYALRRELARGGMGSVWEAEDRKLKRAVAIKVLYALWAESREALMRFEREAMAVARLQSPHVVQIYDYGVDRECPFIVMELLDGEDLRHRLSRGRRLTIAKTADVVAQASRALSAAHAKGIVHRDLKPGNVFLVRGRDDELVKLLDFGVAKARLSEETDQETTREGAILGTPRYMSPEQALQSTAVDYRTDLWSLAVIAFRALTGKVPFAGKSPADVIIRLCTQRPPRATQVAPDLPPTLDAFFERALQQKPEDRFRSARELAAEFARVAEASDPSVDPSSPTPDDATHRQQVQIRRLPRRVPRAIMTTLSGMGPATRGEPDDDEDESPTIGVEGMTPGALSDEDDEAPTIGVDRMDLASLEDDADTAEVLEPAVAPRRPGSSPPPPPKHRKRSADAAAAGLVPAVAGDAPGADDEEEDEEPTRADEGAPEAHGASRFARLLVVAAVLLLGLLVIGVGAIRRGKSHAEDQTEGGVPSASAATSPATVPDVAAEPRTPTPVADDEPSSSPVEGATTTEPVPTEKPEPEAPPSPVAVANPPPPDLPPAPGVVPTAAPASTATAEPTIPSDDTTAAPSASPAPTPESDLPADPFEDRL